MIFQKWQLIFEENGNCDQKLLLLKYFKVYFTYIIFTLENDCEKLRLNYQDNQSGIPEHELQPFKVSLGCHF